MSTTLVELSEFLQKGRVKNVKELVQKALDEGIAPNVILEEGLLSGMSVVGEKFKKNEVFVPEVLIAARAMNAGTTMLKPYLVQEGVESKGTVVIGTVKGDLHDIGKNIVKMMMEGKGMNVIDLGVDVSAEQYVQAAKENDADIIACSTLLTTTMGEIKNVVDLVKKEGIRAKVMIGGAPVTQDFCDSVQADSYTPDAATAAEVAVGFCS
ncbi:corrinoid protein [Phocea massiliensis]|uniref:Corrinoid protein n=1 Tax=Merdimmobilis hominis TaxID=2897707 RepID=A0A938X7G0_9FIRM|nr:corrinoid protein [Merdimmobilis hominis]MBM6921601.1 corrinoid protein [Merdimmobilis hominis]